MVNREIRQSPGAEPRFFYGCIVVVAGLLIMVAMFGVYNAFGIFFKPVSSEFGWTKAVISGAFSLSWAMQGLLGIAMGGLNDRVGPRVVVTLGGFLVGLGFVMMSWISAVWQLYLFYGVIIGAGMSSTWVPLTSTVARWFAKRRSTMTGIVAAGIGVGMLVGAPVSNWIISTYGWRLSYLILGSIVLVLVVPAAQLLRNPSQLGQLSYGHNDEELGLRFKEAVRTKQFWLAFGMLLCFGFCVFSIVVHVVPHAIELGISAASAANILATFGGLSIVGKVALGGAGDRIGSRQVFIIGFILMSATLFWLVLAKEVWMLYLFAAVFGVAYGGCGTSESPLVAALFGLGSHGLIFGVIAFGFTIGAAIGPFMAGYMFDVTGNYQGAFLVSAVIGILGLILTTLLTPTKRS